jgi:hypothetical protein
MANTSQDWTYVRLLACGCLDLRAVKERDGRGEGERRGGKAVRVFMDGCGIRFGF